MRTNKEYYELGIDRFISKLISLQKFSLDSAKLKELQNSMEGIKGLVMEDLEFIERLENDN